jgi:hypothetical protein
MHGIVFNFDQIRRYDGARGWNAASLKMSESSLGEAKTLDLSDAVRLSKLRHMRLLYGRVCAPCTCSGDQ